MMKDILIAYYSWSGNTRRIAEMIHELTNGDIAVTRLCPHSLISDCMEIYGNGSNLNSTTLAVWISRNTAM